MSRAAKHPIKAVRCKHDKCSGHDHTEAAGMTENISRASWAATKAIIKAIVKITFLGHSGSQDDPSDMKAIRP
jgi:hypothetical protein